MGNHQQEKNIVSLLTHSWNKYLEYLAPEQKDIYFTEEYVKLYESSQDKAECFVYQESEYILLFPYLKRKIALLEGDYYDFETAYGYGGPIANTNNLVFLHKAMEGFIQLARENNIIVGFIRFHPMLDNQITAADYCKVHFDRKTIVIDLKVDKEALLPQMHLTHKRSIKKAIEANLQFMVDSDFKHLNQFIEMYRTAMQRKNAEEFYYFSEQYFANLKDLNDNIILSLVYLREKIIAGALFLKQGPRGHYHLAANLPEYKQYCASNFLIYQTALFFKDQGIQLFHLGGGLSGKEDDSLFIYKSRFSKNEFSFYTGKLIFNEEKYNETCALWDANCPPEKQKYKGYTLRYRY